jgi:hypothetical protein
MHANYTIQSRKINGFTRRTVEYDATGSDGNHDPHVAYDLALTKQIAEILERHYPSHPWMVEVSHAQGVAFISLPIIMRRNQRFVLHIDRLKSDPGLRSVVRAGGELLERHNVPRSGFRLDHFLHARAANPMNRPRIIMPS